MGADRARLGDVGDVLEPDAPDALGLVDLDGDRDPRLRLGLGLGLPARSALLLAADMGLIDLDTAPPGARAGGTIAARKRCSIADAV